ncbi:MAG: hypothetical protein PHC53_05375 [Patescibacteria group bacterium]|nr:hypothetical protein [Patescibacteria group bacterium]
MATLFKKVVSFFKTTLAQGMSSSQTTMTLNAIPAGNIEYPNWFVIEPNSANEELVYCPTAPTVKTFSGVVRGVDPTLDTDAAGTGVAHAGNVDVIMAPTHRQHNSLVEVLMGVSALPAVPKLPAARTISDVRHVVDKEYADAMVASGYTAFYVTQNGAAPSLTVNVAAGEYVKSDGTIAYFTGAAAVVVLASQTNYVEMDGAGAVTVNQSGFTSGRFSLAVVITGVATISSISDRRCLMGQNDGTVDKVRTWGNAQTFPANLLLINSDPATANEAVRKSYLDALLNVGDGSDGAFSQSSGTTTWNTALKFIYQFTSFDLTGTAILTLGANLKNQPIIVFVQGNLTITSSGNPAIQLSGFGGAGGGGGAVNTKGGDGTPGAQIISYQSQGIGGTPGTSQGNGGGGGASCNNNGVVGSGAGGTVGAAGLGNKITNIASLSKLLAILSCGAGGGGGGGDPANAAGGAGGDGGGCIIFIVGGNINITAKMYANGVAGTVGATSGSDYGGGGGGGAGGSIAVLYLGSVTANTPTIQVSGGVGGSGGSTFPGGAGGDGYSVVQKINSKILGI